jgi:hypothetical protein
MSKVLVPLPGHVLLDLVVLEQSLVLADRGVAPLTYGKILAVSEEGAAAGIRVDDHVWFDTHLANGFESEGQKYLSVPVGGVVGTLETA